jgi:hypothetical protein
MTAIFETITILLAAILLAVRVRSMLTMWTVRQAWTWMVVALLAVLLHSILSLPVLRMKEAIVSGMAYFAAIMLLTPLVTILGARRPGIFAWHWFVVLPMIVVLQWPAVSQLYGNQFRVPIELSAPLLMGVVVVLVMSVGTLLGTNSTCFALLYAAGIAILLASAAKGAAVQSPVTRFSPILFFAAIWIFHRNLRLQTARLRKASGASLQTKAILDLFAMLYGFAWSRRVQDRIRQFAARERWTVRLTSAGFERSDGSTPTDDELQKPLEAFIWVLARFGDETWLRRVLNSPKSHGPENPPEPQYPILPPN